MTPSRGSAAAAPMQVTLLVGMRGGTGVPAAYEQDLVDLVRCNHSGGEPQLLLEPQSELHEYPVVPPHRRSTMMQQPPHADVDQPRRARLHSEYGAALHQEMVLRQL